jgi:hypothetical protein
VDHLEKLDYLVLKVMQELMGQKDLEEKQDRKEIKDIR